MRPLPIILCIVILGLLAGCASPAGESLARLEGDDESGLGGTGHSGDSGLGGTGIIGEITGFGSIFVNGIEVEIEPRTRLSHNGLPVASYEFARGDVVELRTQLVGGLSVTREVRIRNAVIGQVQQVDVVARRFQVLGQTVQLGSLHLLLPQPGQFVAVSGFRDNAATIHASRVVEVAATPSVWLQGAVQVTSPGQMRIGQQLIDINSASSLEPGTVIGVQGVMRGSRLQVQRRVSTQPFSAEVQQLRVQGYLQGSAAQGYRIGGIALERIDADLVAASMRGQPLRLELRKSGAGAWQALRQIKPLNMPMGRPQALSPLRSQAQPRSRSQVPIPMRPPRPIFSPGRFGR